MPFGALLSVAPGPKLVLVVKDATIPQDKLEQPLGSQNMWTRRCRGDGSKLHYFSSLTPRASLAGTVLSIRSHQSSIASHTLKRARAGTEDGRQPETLMSTLGVAFVVTRMWHKRGAEIQAASSATPYALAALGARPFFVTLLIGLSQTPENPISGARRTSVAGTTLTIQSSLLGLADLLARVTVLVGLDARHWPPNGAAGAALTSGKAGPGAVPLLMREAGLMGTATEMLVTPSMATHATAAGNHALLWLRSLEVPGKGDLGNKALASSPWHARLVRLTLHLKKHPAVRFEDA
ncbi:unnamed protein product [Cutaneotrichosporon oleaginosum]